MTKSLMVLFCLVTTYTMATTPDELVTFNEPEEVKVESSISSAWQYQVPEEFQVSQDVSIQSDLGKISVTCRFSDGTSWLATSSNPLIIILLLENCRSQGGRGVVLSPPVIEL